VVDLIVGAGVTGVTALGVTGEVARLNERERHLIVDTVVKQVAGRAQVIVGASADGVRTCIEYSREARSLGASAVMVSPPRMLKLNTESVVSHYKALADAVPALPRVLAARFGAPVFGVLRDAARTSDPDLAALVRASLRDTTLRARFADEVRAVEAVLAEAAPKPRDPSRIVHGTRKRGRR
jgi:hypothetical protein